MILWRKKAIPIRDGSSSAGCASRDHGDLRFRQNIFRSDHMDLQVHGSVGPGLPNPIEIRGKGPDIFITEIGKNRAARGGNIGQLFGLAKARGSALHIIKGDARNRYLLQIGLQQSGEGEIPKRRRDDDLVGLRELSGIL